MSLSTIIVPSEYSYVIGTFVASAFVLQWMGFRVTSARKRLGVELPSLYADAAEARKDKDKHLFNCVQRGHQNTIESYAQFVGFLAIGGLKHPPLASAGGVVYLAGRIAFMLGYSTGDPSRRRAGMFGYLGLITLLGTTISTALSIGKFL
eukprot:TRINITY_DN2482_c0_g1_i1.p2 TRINITY_DN2482_c0_g1~~TRINITY_DN2482_c0_g1_i1.p2  ORF type:complete len:150 (-),score=38.59 TRINITY_DN2482_c0_g1_i1:53-502(-)